jgi:hypothetical protein
VITPVADQEIALAIQQQSLRVIELCLQSGAILEAVWWLVCWIRLVGNDVRLLD